MKDDTPKAPHHQFTKRDVRAWFVKLDEYLDEAFIPGGRQQPAMPPPRKIFDE